MDQETRTTLTSVLTCLRELLRQIDAGEVTVTDRQRANFQEALTNAERLAAEHARSNGS